MTDKHFVVATAGHVDHGKSALVKALTGTDPDRLPEEKAREITIDLGFAHLDLPLVPQNPSVRDSSLSISIIDVPGHEDFIRNMIAGLGSIDLGLLVVAADDGWMPQTEEHLQILIYLGVSRIVVAMNKSDIGRPDETAIQIKDRLRNTPFTEAPVIATSALSGLGLDQLKNALSVVLANATPQRDIRKARLLIDRAFNLPGIGAVVTGTLSGGSIHAGEPLYIQPGNFRTRGRSLQTHRKNVDVALPGMRTGVNLTDIPKTSATEGLRRGLVLTTEQFESSSTIDVLLEKSARLHVSHPAARPLKSGTRVHLHHGASRTEAMLVFSDEKALAAGESAIAQLRLASPILAFVGDRFVIRDRSEQYTIAGGTILYPNGSAKLFRTVNQQKLLRARSANPADRAICIESELIRRGPGHIGSLLRNSNFSAAEVEAALSDFQKSGRAVVRGEIVADIKSWQSLRQLAVETIDRTHQTNSQQKGLELSDLRTALSAYSGEVIEALIEEICDTDFVRCGSIIARTSHRPRLPAQLEQTAKKILTALTEKPLDPPARNRIAADTAHRQALRYLIEQGDVVELGPDLLVSGEAFAQAKEIVTSVIATSGAATVSELRESLQTSRRVAVPLLERLDRDRVTRRLGDRRVLAEGMTVPTGPQPA
ncbi:MAG TPA: selenocysteine-specific translation elongation factor [Chthoniobacterales bacterium]